VPKIVVLGGGIAGVEAAIALREKGLNVTLVSDREYLFIYPVSIWIPTREMDCVQSIKAKENTVILKKKNIKYDYLVVALGADKIQMEGIEHTISICGHPEGSIRFRDKLDELVERGEGKIAFGFAGNPKDPGAVRGGPAYELLFNTVHMLKKKGLRDEFEITFFAPMDNPGAKMGKKALQLTDYFFNKQKIKTQLGKKIKKFVPDGIVFEDGTKLDSDLTMFISGAQGKQEVLESDLPLSDANFIQINEQCQAEGFSNVFAIGDIANI